MSNEANFHVIKDPVHGTMQFTSIEDRWIKPFIDSPPFQRLRHIKQLGMADYIFPGAVHTRFNHSLGCCYIASLITHQLDIPSHDRQLVLIACLLHDMGHGPFSHTFEDLFQNKCIRHEDWTPFFLEEYRTNAFFDSYNTLNPQFPLTIEKFDCIQAMIMHQKSAPSLLADIVSSQLDADRLDYLLRDSHFCGVTYGQFDFKWMLNSMTIIETPLQQKRLGLTHKGIGVVEHYLMARRLMIKNIYLHQKKLAFEFFLIRLLVLLSQQLAKEALFKKIKETRLGAFLQKVHQFNTDKTRIKTDFLSENYLSYKELGDYDVFVIIKSLAEMTQTTSVIDLAQRLQQRVMPKIIRIDNALISETKNVINTFKSAHPDIYDWQLALLDSQHQSYTAIHDPISIINEKGNIKTLSELSFMINAIENKSEHHAFICVDQVLYHNNKYQPLLSDLFDVIQKQR